jgi:hypothetical protein
LIHAGIAKPKLEIRPQRATPPSLNLSTLRAVGLRGWSTFTIVAAALTLMLSSCGDDSSKKTDAAAGSTGTGATSGATGTTGTSGSKGSKPARKRKSGGGAETPSSSGDAGADQGKRTDKGGGEDKSKPKGDRGPGARSNFTTQEWQYYRQSKVVCKGLGIDVLANQYHVARTAKAAATAYADAYAKTFGKGTRDSVYRGCRSAFLG